MAGLGPVIAFGIPGIWEVGLILVALAFYGRSGSRLLMGTRYGRFLKPWKHVAEAVPRGQSSARRGSPPSSPLPVVGAWRNDRWFWALTLIAAAAVASWVVTRMVISGGSVASHGP